MMASVALTMALGALGRGDDLTTVAQAALDRAITSFQASHMRFWFGSVYARACRLTGRIDECVAMVARLADSAREVPSLAYANLASLMGVAELMRGDVRAAVKLLHEALAGVERHGVTTGLRPATCFLLAEAHAKLGEAEAAKEAIAEAQSCVPPDYLFMQTALSVATGWSLAANGCVNEAIATVKSAARQGARTQSADSRTGLSAGGGAVGRRRRSGARPRARRRAWICRWPKPLPGIRNRWPPTMAKVCWRRRANTGR